jgi:hypothetical protein
MMDPSHDLPADPQPDWARLLPREAFHEIVLILRGALPPPVSDDPGGLVRRDRAAMAAVAALRPENAAEGRLAAQFVAADAWAMDCLRLAGERRRELEIARKCRAQAASMMREGKSALRMLLKLQAVRQAIEADEAAANRAAWAEHAVAGVMEEALGTAPAAPDRPTPAPEQAGDDEFADARSGWAGKFRLGHKNENNSRNSLRETEPRPRLMPARAAS